MKSAWRAYISFGFSAQFIFLLIIYKIDMEGLTHMKNISAEAAEYSSLEERIKVIEEKLNILIKQFNDLPTQSVTAPGPSKAPEAPSEPWPREYDDDADWYTSHGQGD